MCSLSVRDFWRAGSVGGVTSTIRTTSIPPCNRPCLWIVCNIQYAMPLFQRPQTVAEGVYQHLRRELLSGRLEAGQWLREQELAESLQVSRKSTRLNSSHVRISYAVFCLKKKNKVRTKLD